MSLVEIVTHAAGFVGGGAAWRFASVLVKSRETDRTQTHKERLAQDAAESSFRDELRREIDKLKEERDTAVAREREMAVQHATAISDMRSLFDHVRVLEKRKQEIESERDQAIEHGRRMAGLLREALERAETAEIRLAHLSGIVGRNADGTGGHGAQS